MTSKGSSPLFSVMENLERVEGIARFHERMWIKRDEDGLIEQVYDGDFQPLEKHMLYRSFLAETQDDGFLYKGEFIALENAREVARKRALGYQRRNRGHGIDSMM